MTTDKDNGSLDQFLRRLITAPRARQETVIRSALSLLDGKPQEDRLFYNGREAAK